MQQSRPGSVVDAVNEEVLWGAGEISFMGEEILNPACP